MEKLSRKINFPGGSSANAVLKNLLNPLCVLFCACAVAQAYTVSGFTPDQILEYKQTTNSTGEAVTLHLEVFTPPGYQTSDQRPAIVFFFGGGRFRPKIKPQFYLSKILSAKRPSSAAGGITIPHAKPLALTTINQQLNNRIYGSSRKCVLKVR